MGGGKGDGKSKGKVGGGSGKGSSEKGEGGGGRGGRGPRWAPRDKETGKGGEQQQQPQTPKSPKRPVEEDVHSKEAMLAVFGVLKAQRDGQKPEFALSTKNMSEPEPSKAPKDDEPPSTPKREDRAIKRLSSGFTEMDPNAKAFVPGALLLSPGPRTPGGSKRISLADHVEETPKGSKVGASTPSAAVPPAAAEAAQMKAAASPASAVSAVAAAQAAAMAAYGYSMQQQAAAAAAYSGLGPEMMHYLSSMSMAPAMQRAAAVSAAMYNQAAAGGSAGYTTVMLRHIPNRYTRDMLIDRLNEGYRGQFDFVYLPIDFNSKCNVGYAFINFRQHHVAQKFIVEFNGVRAKQCLPGFSSKKVCEVSFATVQGQEANMENFRDEKFIEKLKERPEWHPLFYDKAGKEIPLTKVLGQTSKRRRNSALTGPVTGYAGAAAYAAQAQASLAVAAAVSTPYAAAAAAMMSPTGAFSPFGMMGSPFGVPGFYGAVPGPPPSTRLEGVLPSASKDTLLMLKNVPTSLTRTQMIQLLNKKYKGCYDFLFLPGDFHGGASPSAGAGVTGGPTPNRGFVFLNFRKTKDAARFKQDFDGKPPDVCFDTPVPPAAAAVPPVEGAEAEAEAEDMACKVEEAKLPALEKSIQRLQTNDAKGESLDEQIKTKAEWYPVLIDADGGFKPFPTLTSPIQMGGGKVKGMVTPKARAFK